MTRRGLGHKPIEYDAARLASLLSGWLSSNMPIHDHSSSLEGGDDLHALEEVEFNDAVLLTIATGIITRSQVYHQVDTEASGATDDLDTISGGAEGDLLIVRAANSARTVVVKHGTGNVRFASGNDYILDDDTDHVALVFDGADWCDIGGAGATIINHAVLSATHTGTLPAAIVQGDILVGNATPVLARQAIGANETTLRSNGAMPAWVALFDAINPTSIDVGDTAAVGTAATAPRRDHQHAVTSSSNPGAAASLLATEANGFVQLLGLGIGATPTVGNRITMINGGDIGIASGVTTRFNSTSSPDRFQVHNGDLYIATTAHGIIHVDGNTAGHVLRANGTRFVPSAIQAGDLPGSFAGFANPTASVGLSTVNGSATTAMRSDAAPALSQAITPTWTGLHTFNANIVLADGVTVGQAAGPLLTFDDTNNYLEILGCKIGAGTPSPRQMLDVAGNIITDWNDRWFGTWYQAGADYKLGFRTITGTRTLNLHALTGDASGEIIFSTGTVAVPSEKVRITYGGNVGVGTTAPGGPLDVVESDAATTTVADVIILEHITSGTAAANFGAGLLYQLEDAGGTVRNASRLATVWQNAGGVENAEFQLWLNQNGTLYDCGIVVGPGAATAVVGNQRGLAAVDWQGRRTAATQVASGQCAVIGGGYLNTSSNTASVAGGGYNNTASGSTATVSGGHTNTASGANSTIPGGYGNTASGSASFAAGQSATASHVGSFVWSNNAAATVSWGTDTWTARCHGGARFYSAAGVGTGVQLSAGGNAWAGISDRAAKENFRAVDDILGKIAVLPLYNYNLKSQDASVRHIGPVAQDFNEIFGFTEDRLRINSMDISGVTLAGVKALIAENELLKKRVLSLETRSVL